MKKFFRLAIVFAIAGAALLTGCTKDYSVYITDLQDQIDALDSRIKTVESALQNGAVLNDVTSIANGIRVTYTKDGKTQTADIVNGTDGKDGKDGKDGANGKDGKDGAAGAAGKNGTNGTNGTNGKDGKDGKDGTPGTVITISEDGYWVLDGVKSDKKAVGQDGTNGTNGKDGKDGISWEIKEVDGVLSFVSNEVPPTVKAVFENGAKPVVAKWENDALTLYNVEGANGPVVISFNAVLASVVGVPQVYFEGVEAFEYYHIEGKVGAFSGENVAATDENNTPAVIKAKNAFANNGAAYNIGEEAIAQYWVNPASYDATKNSTYALTGGDYEVVTRGAAEWAPTFKSIAKAEKNLYNVHYTISKADKLQQAGKMSTMNFRITDTKANKEVNSDYLAIVPRQEALAAIAFSGNQQALDCNTAGLKDELWKTAKDAVQHAPSVSVGYKQVEGLALDFFAIHMNPNKVGTLNTVDNTKHVAKTLADIKARYGAELSFELVDVTFGNNTTSENAYGVIKDGKFYPAYAGANGQAVQITEATDPNVGISAVGRTPVVLVKLVRDGKDLLAGYFKLLITKDEAKPVTSDFILKDMGEFAYLCVNQELTSVWYEMSYNILEKELKMDYATFHQKFTWEPNKTYYKKSDGTFAQCTGDKNYGTVVFTKDTGVGAINDKFTVSVNKAQADKIGNGKSQTLYAKFTALDNSLVYIGFTVKIGAKPASEFVTKNPVYWYSDVNNEANKTIRNNVLVPENYGYGNGNDDVTVFTKKIDDNWVGNKVNVNVTPAAPATANQTVEYRYRFSKTQPSVGKPSTAIKKESDTSLSYNGVEIITLDDVKTGKITYKCNATTKQLINWATNPADKEPSARLLYCNVELYAYYTDANDTKCIDLGTETIHVRFLRPVDFDTKASDNLVDGVPGIGSTIAIGKLFSAKDWQGYKIFWFDQTANAGAGAYVEGVYPATNPKVNWFKYYGINKLTVDLDKVETSQAQAAGEFALLKTNGTTVGVNDAAKVSVIQQSSGARTYAGKKEIAINDINDLADYLFSYQNNMGYASDFQLRIPFAIDYSWGTYEGFITVDVFGTSHNYQN